MIVVKGNRTDETLDQRYELRWCPASLLTRILEVNVQFKFVSLVGYGAEEIDDQFGSQIMLHKGPNDKVVGRIEYVEVTRAGQAFRLGRYPGSMVNLNGE